MDSGQSPLPNGFAVPVHRALTEHILLGGAPRGLAIANATLAGAIGLGLQLWIAGAAFFALGHMVAVWAARHDPQFVDVARRRGHAQHLLAAGPALPISRPFRPRSRPSGPVRTVCVPVGVFDLGDRGSSVSKLPCKKKL